MFINDGSCKWELKKITNAEQLNGLSINELKQNISSGIEIFYGTISPNIVVGSHTEKYYTIYHMGIQFTLPSGYTKEQCKILAFDSYSMREYIGSSWNDYHDVMVVKPKFLAIDSDLRSEMVYQSRRQEFINYPVNYIIFAKK